MSFGHPSQHAHKLQGMAKAARSPKTPAHLRAHLTRLSGGTMASPTARNTKGTSIRRGPTGMPLHQDPNNGTPQVRVPTGVLLKTTNQASVDEAGPDDASEFDTTSKDTAPMSKHVGKTTTAPKAPGSRPSTISPRLPRQGASGRSIQSVARKQERGPGIQKRVAGAKLRNQLPGKGRSYPKDAFYGY